MCLFVGTYVEESGSSFGLLLFSVNALNGKVDVVEEFVMEFDGQTRGEEDHHLPLTILLQKSVQQMQSPLTRTNYITLKN